MKFDLPVVFLMPHGSATKDWTYNGEFHHAVLERVSAEEVMRDVSEASGSCKGPSRSGVALED
jgi:hypothetical protein